MIYSEAGQTAKLSSGGIAIFEDRIQNCHQKCDEIFALLNTMEERLYNPRPSPVMGTAKEIGQAGAKRAVEGNVNFLEQRLGEMQNIVARILHG